MHREWEAAYEQLSMERGYCTVSRGTERYTPANLSLRALSPPNARWALFKRGAEMTWRMGGYFALLAVDKLTGQNNVSSQVKLRAAQLRCVRGRHQAVSLRSNCCCNLACLPDQQLGMSGCAILWPAQALQHPQAHQLLFLSSLGLPALVCPALVACVADCITWHGLGMACQ